MKQCIRTAHVPIQDVPILSSPFVPVLSKVKSSHVSPVTLEQSKDPVRECFPEPVVVYFSEAFV